MELTYTKPDIKDGAGKPVAYANKGFSYSGLDDRRFEELLYSIGKGKIEDGDWKDKFDDINLLHGVRERGRDCSLHRNGKSYGLIQCKHSIDDQNRISRPECAREIIKFVLHYLIDKKLIHDTEDFTYYFSVSYGFNEEAKDLLDDFNVEILSQPELQAWTETVIGSYKGLEDLKYAQIENDLKSVLGSISVEKITPQDLDLLLNADGNQNIINTFFEVKTVIETEAVDALKKEVIEKIDQLGEYAEKSRMPTDKILEKFEHASFHLSNYHSVFGDVQDSHIKRNETAQLLQWVKTPVAPKEEPIALLAGNAGIGKTVILKDLLLELKNEEIPVVGFKADRYYAGSIKELEEKMNLEDSFEKLIRTLKVGYERIVILIDQIDALSQSLSAKRDYLDTFTLLVRKLSAIDGVRVIISARIYDLNYDHELSFYKNQKVFKVGLLEKGQIEVIVKKMGGNPSAISGDLIELLRTPHHLNVFCKIYDPNINLNSIATLHDLYNNLWRQKVINVAPTSLSVATKCINVVYQIAERMYEDQRLSISSHRFVDEFSHELDYLKSNEIITEENNEIQFFHQTFYDYSFAKQFIENKKSIIKYIEENHQGLYIRSCLKMIVVFLREHDHEEYIKVLSQILFNRRYRFHLKLLLINMLGFQEAPSEQELELVRSRILSNKRFEVLFLESANGTAWLNLLIDEKVLAELFLPQNRWYDKLINSKLANGLRVGSYSKNKYNYVDVQERHVNKVNLCLRTLLRQLPKERRVVLDFLRNCPVFEEKGRFVFQLLYHVKIWDEESAFQLFEQYLNEAARDKFGYYKILEDAMSYRPEWVISIYRESVMKKLEAVKKASEKPKFNHDDEEMLKKLFQIDPVTAFDFCLEIIQLMSDGTSRKDKGKLYGDIAFMFVDHNGRERSVGNGAIFHLFVDEIQKMSQNKSPKFDEFVQLHSNSNSTTILRLLIYGFMSNPSEYADEVFDFIETFHGKRGLEYEGKLQFQLRELLPLVYPNFDSGQKDTVARLILSLKPKLEVEVFINQRTQRKCHSLHLFGYTKFLYLKSIPQTDIDANLELKKAYQELERKFPEIIDKEPNTIRTGFGGAPLEKGAYEKMNFKQWKATFQKYNSDSLSDHVAFGGSLIEHSRAFQVEVEKRPSHFFTLVESLIDDQEVPGAYIISGLQGLKEAKYDPVELRSIYKRAIKISFDSTQTLYLVWFADYFIEHKNVDVEILQFLADAALHHEDPAYDNDESDMLQRGMNTVRGAATDRLVRIHFNPSFKDLIFSTLDKVSEDKCVSVRVSIMPRLAFLMHLDEQKTLELFLKMTRSQNPDILRHSIFAVQYLVHRNFKRLQSYFEKAIIFEPIQADIARILAIAWLNGSKDGYKLLKQVLKISDKAKASVIDVATHNLFDKDEKVASRSRKLWYMFLNNDVEEITHQYSVSFLHLPPDGFLQIYELIKKYSDSKVAKRNPQYYFEYLLKCAKKHPKRCIDLIGNFHMYERPDMTQSGYYEDEPIKVLIGAYNSLRSVIKQDTKYLNRSMKIFDRMLKDQRFRGSANKVINQVDL